MKNTENSNNAKKKHGISNMSMKTKWLITGGLCVLAVLTVMLCVLESATPASNVDSGNSAVKYKVLVTAGNGGSADPNGSVSVNEWGSLTVKFTPDEGYEIQAVTVDGDDKGAVESYTLSYVTSDHSIVATFAKIPEPTPTVQPTANVPNSDGED